jgi:nicotinate-nucleotide pyrophosphorylase (carboxylating)
MPAMLVTKSADPPMQPSTLALIRAAIAEDIGTGDVTSEFFIPADSRSRANLVAREDGVMSGVDIARTVFLEIDRGTEVRVLVADGQPFEKDDTLVEISGSTRSVLSAERTALNFLQRLCGVATMTRRYVDAVKPHAVKVLDTRKTTPGWRLLEKAAVKDGGGTNHRIGLYDQVMVKDNHLVAAGGIDALQSAIDRVKAARPGIKVQIEADRLEQVETFLKLRDVDMLLLDNMTPATLCKAVTLNAGRLFLEASGGITLATIGDVAATGVDAISVGALTHSARALDLALDFV